MTTTSTVINEPETEYPCYFYRVMNKNSHFQQDEPPGDRELL